MRKGISMIELLIVILVISVLASMMFFSSTEAVEAARATSIINNLQKMKQAMNDWYIDNHDRFFWTDNGYLIAIKQNSDGTWEKSAPGDTVGRNPYRLHIYFSSHPEEFAPYFDSAGLKFNDTITSDNQQDWMIASQDSYYASVGSYAIYCGFQNKKCYVVAKISDSNSGSAAVLRQKLKARAKSAGLLMYEYNNSTRQSTEKEYDGQKSNVFMEAFDLMN